MMSYSEQLQRIIKRYEETGNPLPATAHEIATWAIEQNLWEPQRSTLLNRCAEEIARAMREEHITDPQGRRVRVKHVAMIGKTANRRHSGPICEGLHASIWKSLFSNEDSRLWAIAGN
jgi:hypothetical protein